MTFDPTLNLYTSKIKYFKGIIKSISRIKLGLGQHSTMPGGRL